MADYSGKSVAWCRKLGWPAEPVYRPWSPHTRRAKDFMGVIDVMAYDGQPGILGIQATGKSGEASKHLQKIRSVVAGWPDELRKKREQKNGAAWAALPDRHPILLHLEAGNRLQVWAFRKVAVKRGGKALVWRPRVLSLTASSLLSEACPKPRDLVVPTPLPEKPSRR